MLSVSCFSHFKNLRKFLYSRTTDWKRIFANHISDEGLIPEIYKELTQLSSKNNHPIKSGPRTQKGVFLKKTRKWPGGVWRLLLPGHWEGSWDRRDATLPQWEWLLLGRRAVTSTVGVWTEGHAPAGMQSSAATMETSMEMPPKVKNRTTMAASSPVSGYEGMKSGAERDKFTAASQRCARQPRHGSSPHASV